LSLRLSTGLRLLLAACESNEPGAFVRHAAGVWCWAEQVCPAPHPCRFLVLRAVIAVAALLSRSAEPCKSSGQGKGLALIKPSKL